MRPASPMHRAIVGFFFADSRRADNMRSESMIDSARVATLTTWARLAANDAKTVAKSPGVRSKS